MCVCMCVCSRFTEKEEGLERGRGTEKERELSTYEGLTIIPIFLRGTDFLYKYIP